MNPEGISVVNPAELKYQEALKSLKPEQKEIFTGLSKHDWFKKTAPELKLELAQLPEDHDGFLKDLVMRPDSLGGMKVERLLKLPRGNYALIPMFETENEKDGKKGTYEYVSWKNGPESGAKGLVLVKGKNGQISHFILLRGDKFATGQQEWDLTGGFGEKDDKTKGPFATITREVQEEFGLKELKIQTTLPLGRMRPDAGMTNNHPELFAVIIDAEQASKINENSVNLDPKELKAGPLIVPIKQLNEMCLKNEDSYFHFVVNKLNSLGVISTSPQATR